MTDSTVAAGKDAWALSTSPDAAHPEPKRPRLTAGVAEAFVSLPLKQQVADRNVTSAILSCPVRDSWAPQTITVAAVTEKWSPRTLSWSGTPGRPAVGASVSEAQPALAAGERFEVDVTSLVQAIASGADNFGFRISTNSAAANRLYGFATGQPSWQVELAFEDQPEAPTPQAPLGGAVGIEPVVAWDYNQGAGEEDVEQAASRVWVNTSPTQTGAADSGWVSNELPEYDLASLSGWSPSSGTTYYWQVQTRDGVGSESDLSDWAEFTYRPYPSLTLTNPGTGLVWDPTPTIAFALGGGAVIRQYRIQVFTHASGKKRYDSGWENGGSATSITRTLPEKWKGARVHVDDRTYRLVIRVRDRLDREATGDDPGMIVSSTTYVFDDDATPVPVSDLHVTQIGDTPRMRLSWTRPSGVTKAWVIHRDGRRIARVDADDDSLEGAGTSWSWIDDGATGYQTHVWTVKAIDNSSQKQTIPSPEAFGQSVVKGVWLLGEDTEVVLDELNIDGFRNDDRRAIYSPIGLEHDIDIVYALRGLSGPFVGGISSIGGRDWEAALETLKAMRSDTDEPVRLVYGTVNVPVILRNVSPGLPAPEILPNNMLHAVTFEAHQVDEFGDD